MRLLMIGYHSRLRACFGAALPMVRNFASARCWPMLLKKSDVDWDRDDA